MDFIREIRDGGKDALKTFKVRFAMLGVFQVQGSIALARSRFLPQKATKVFVTMNAHELFAFGGIECQRHSLQHPKK